MRIRSTFMAMSAATAMFACGANASVLVDNNVTANKVTAKGDTSIGASALDPDVSAKGTLPPLSWKCIENR